MNKIFNTAKVPSFRNQKVLLSLDPHLTQIFSNSRDVKKLEYYWNEWRNATGARMRENFINNIDLVNEAARYIIVRLLHAEIVSYGLSICVYRYWLVLIYTHLSKLDIFYFTRNNIVWTASWLVLIYVRLNQQINNSCAFVIVRLNGFKDGTEMKVAAYESETFVKDMEDTWNGLKPLYEQLHAYVRSQLLKL